MVTYCGYVLWLRIVVTYCGYVLWLRIVVTYCGYVLWLRIVPYDVAMKLFVNKGMSTDMKSIVNHFIKNVDAKLENSFSLITYFSYHYHILVQYTYAYIL